MIKKTMLLSLVALLLFSWGCEKEATKLNHTGTLNAKVHFHSELGQLKYTDQEGLTAKLEGSDPLITVETDENGEFQMTNIPPGTYNMVLNKEGYGEMQYQGFQIVGGIEAISRSYIIHEKSKTKIENLSLTINSDGEIFAEGIIYHNYTEVIDWQIPSVTIYYYEKNNVSDTLHTNYRNISIYANSGGKFSEQLFYSSPFESGKTYYAIAYGYNNSYSIYYDIISERHIRNNLGEASNIASITIP